jgi:uncharacterized protein (TIGR03118 family)
MQVPNRRRALVGAGAVIAACAAVVASPASAGAHAGGNAFHRINLVSDQPGKAQITDPNLVNAWGMSHGPNTPLWVSDNGKDVSTLYAGATGGAPVAAVPLVVSTPGGAPTGQVFNDTTGFDVPGSTRPALFIFAGENGDISAWNQSDGTMAVAVHHFPHTVYKGLALVHSPFGPLLLATNFHGNRVDVFNARFHRLAVAGLFRDSRIPAGYAPFNVAAIGNRVFVTYARQDGTRHDDVPGAGHGFIDVFTNYGTLVRRFASRGVLNSPWGLQVAPSGFGRFGGDLLVGNFGDGRIHVFNVHTGALLATLHNRHGHDIVIPGLWGLLQGDPAAGGSGSVWFSAGPDGESHGLLGLLRA